MKHMIEQLRMLADALEHRAGLIEDPNGGYYTEMKYRDAADSSRRLAVELEELTPKVAE
jgi:hypothetical protein